MTLHICCIRAGDRFSPAYVNILFDSVRRNLVDGFEGVFTCFTDQPDKLDDGIQVSPLPADLPGWWGKLSLHKDGVFPKGSRVLYLDLACVITGRLDELAAYQGPFAILRDFYRPNGLQSAVMAWEAGTSTDIWDGYLKGGCDLEFELHDTWGDQAFIESVRLDAAVRLQDEFPGLFASYKVDRLYKNPPATASVVVFHGKPKPEEISIGWVPEVWKVGGMTRADLDTVCNTANEQLLANIRSSTARDLTWFDTAPEHDGHVCIVGGGPSVADKLEELEWRQSLGQKIWALNGAAHYLYTQGIIPDALVIADAREENKAFLPGAFLPDFTTRLYLASQCHPALFDKAELLDLDVTLWHVNSEGVAELLADVDDKPVHLIGGGSTVGLNAIVLGFAEGYRKFHLYGFDSSFEENHHAYRQTGNDGDVVIDALFDGRVFKTTAWMAQQVNEFQDLIPGLIADGCVVTVSGNGLLPTVARYLAENMPVAPAEQRANEVLSRLPGIEKPKGAEIGVFKGDMSACLLRGCPDLELIMVDSWEGSGAAYEGDSGDWHADLTDSAQEEFMAAAERRVDFAGSRAVINRGRSVDMARDVPDGSLDFVFIDADHSYDGCKADIEAWAPKLKAGGWLCGHDYENTSFPKFGVTQAVAEYLEKTGLSLELGENFTWFIRLPSHQQEQ
jgi:hypothetical protein